MNSGDMVRVNYTNGVAFFYEVVGVYLGATDQDGVVELVSVNRQANTQGKLLVPVCLLDVLKGSGSIVVYSK